MLIYFEANVSVFKVKTPTRTKPTHFALCTHFVRLVFAHLFDECVIAFFRSFCSMPSSFLSFLPPGHPPSSLSAFSRLLLIHSTAIHVYILTHAHYNRSTPYSPSPCQCFAYQVLRDEYNFPACDKDEMTLANFKLTHSSALIFFAGFSSKSGLHIKCGKEHVVNKLIDLISLSAVVN